VPPIPAVGLSECGQGTCRNEAEQAGADAAAKFGQRRAVMGRRGGPGLVAGEGAFDRKQELGTVMCETVALSLMAVAVHDKLSEAARSPSRRGWLILSGAV
jgi:hypothetical protein